LLLALFPVLCHAQTDAPRYDRAMWLEDAAAVADAVVSGTAKQNSDGEGRIEIDRVYWKTGGADDDQTGPKLGELCPPFRCKPNSSGLWILLRRPSGYLAINPDEQPIAPDQWSQLQPLLKLRNETTSRSTQERNLRTVRSTRTIAGREVPRVLTISGPDEKIVVELSVDGRRVLHWGFDDEGKLTSIFRLDANGNGFDLTTELGQPLSWTRYTAGKKDGVSREYFRHKPQQLREEITWRTGVRNGTSRSWDEDGKPTADVLYDDGFIAPVFRYRGTATTRPATAYNNERGEKFYSSPAGIKINELLKVGMTAQEVSDTLKVDFSEKSGITFPFFTRTLMLRITFADGKIASMRTGDNSVCFEPPARK
jgi:hypothetical protein